MARSLLSSLVLFVLIGCQKSGSSADRVTFDLAGQSKGTPVASFKGGAVTVEDVNRQLATLPPMVRMRFQAANARKDYVEGLARVELLSREAIRRGLQNDPDVLENLKKILAQKVLQQTLEQAAPQPSDEDVKSWYDAHLAEYQRPETVQVQDLFLSADTSDAARRKTKAAEAQKLLTKARALKADDEKGFADLVRASSDDPLTRSLGGDLRPMPVGDLQARHGAEVAEATKALQSPGAISPVVSTDKGFHILRLKARTPARTLPLDEAKAQIRNRLFAERRNTASDELLKGLKDQSGYKLDEAALAQISTPAPAPGAPGMPPPPHGAGAGGPPAPR
jgi:parvulin-like peptidyl-prolyl isomerase